MTDDEWDLGKPGTSWGSPIAPTNPFAPPEPSAPVSPPPRSPYAVPPPQAPPPSPPTPPPPRREPPTPPPRREPPPPRREPPASAPPDPPPPPPAEPSPPPPPPKPAPPTRSVRRNRPRPPAQEVESEQPDGEPKAIAFEEALELATLEPEPPETEPATEIEPDPEVDPEPEPDPEPKYATQTQADAEVEREAEDEVAAVAAFEDLLDSQRSVDVEDRPGWGAPDAPSPREPEPTFEASVQPGIDSGMFPPAYPVPLPPSRPPTAADLRALPPPSGRPVGDLGSLPPPDPAQRRVGADYYPRAPRGWPSPSSLSRPTWRRSTDPGSPRSGNPVAKSIGVVFFLLFFGSSMIRCVADVIDGPGSDPSTEVIPGFGGGSGGTGYEAYNVNEVVLGRHDGLSLDVLILGGIPGGGDGVSRLAMSGPASAGLWTSEPFMLDSGLRAVPNSDGVYVGYVNKIFLLDGTTGERVDERDLPGTVTELLVVNDVVVVEVDDGSVLAFRGGIDEPIWTRGADQPSHVTEADGVLLAYQDPGDLPGSPDGPTKVSVVEPATGKDQGTVDLSCPGSGFSASDLRDSIGRIPGTRDFVVAPRYSYGCAARWNQDTSEVRWISQVNLPNLGYRTQLPLLVGSDHLTMSSRDGRILLVDLADGTSGEIAPPAGWSVWPRVVVGDTVVVDAVKAGPPVVGAVMAFDMTSGTQLWNFRLPEGVVSSSVVSEEVDGTAMYQLDEDMSLAYVATLAGGGSSDALRLYTVDASTPGSLDWIDIDPETGNRTKQARQLIQDRDIDAIQVEAYDERYLALRTSEALVVVPAGEDSGIMSYPPA